MIITKRQLIRLIKEATRREQDTFKVGDLVRSVDFQGDGRGGDFEKAVGDQIGTVIEIDDSEDGPIQYIVNWSTGEPTMDDADGFQLAEGLITKRQLRRTIREAAAGKTLFMTHGDYGYIGLKDDAGNEYSMGEIIGELLDTGKALEIFDLNHEARERAQEKLQAKREQPDAAGPMESWDVDVFDQYYDVDNEKAVHAWAKMNAFTVEEAEGEEGLGDPGDWR